MGASTGLFAAATAEARGLAIAGRSRYRAALASATASFVPYPGRVTVDGEVLHEGETLLVNVGGGRHRAGVLNVLPLSVRDDGLLDVCVVGAGAAPARVLESMRDGAHLGLPGVRYATGRRIVVERTDGRVLEWESDGEVGPADRSRLVLDVLPGLLPVIASADRPGG
nr:hypothetical protein [Kitasatospora sp. SID7827]